MSAEYQSLNLLNKIQLKTKLHFFSQIFLQTKFSVECITGNLWQFLLFHILRDIDRGGDRNISKSNQVHNTTQYINEYSELLPNHNTFVRVMYKCRFWAINFSPFFQFFNFFIFFTKLEHLQISYAIYTTHSQFL